LRKTAHQFGYCGIRIVTFVLTVIALLALFLTEGQSVQGQSQNAADSAILQGTVLDSRGHPLAAAALYLQEKTGTQTLTAHSDSAGAYRFSALGEGVYTLRAEMAGYTAATFGPCVLGPKEVKRIDLTLEAATVSTPQSGSTGTSGAARPQFFDEPEFAVAGVTEAMNPGGHGSDTILRNTEALAKETASLSVTAPNKESNSSPTASASSSSSTTAEESLRQAAEREPGNFATNRQLGKLLVDNGKPREALPYLERASQLNPSDYENTYELVLAYADGGQYERARTQGLALLTRQDKLEREHAQLHHLLGDVEENLGNPLEAVREYQRAAELDQSEPNLFDWGADLLIHRAFEPASEVFSKGNRLFPRSVRMLAGLGVAGYARGAYDQAAQYLCQAADLNPEDPNPYLFLGKMQSVETTQSECLVERLGRFFRLQPENALANYYYALSLWNRHEGSQSSENLARVESLLEKTVHLDPKFGAAYLRLGILYSDRGDSTKAIAAYQEATDASPGLEEAHYRLAQAYGRAGEKSKAQAELLLYKQLSKKTAEEVERQRREIQQFVYTLRDRTSASPPQ
jgi:tetratricopeptide (TPR) repeat protein